MKHVRGKIDVIHKIQAAFEELKRQTQNGADIDKHTFIVIKRQL